MRNLSICFILAALTCAVYWPARHLPFVNYDDEGYVYENPHILKGLSWQTIKWSATATDLANYHPVTWLSYALDISLFGPRPSRFHQENVVLHAINTALLFLVLLKATGNVLPSALAAGFFGVHPLHVESVAWISERKDLFSMLFFLLAVGAYLIYVRRENPRQKWLAYAAMTAFFIVGLLAKAMIVTFPLVLLLLDYWPLRRADITRRRLIIEKVPLLMISAISCWITIKVQSAGGAMMTLQRLPIGARLENCAVSYGRYLGKVVWPVRLSIFYPHPLFWANSTVIASIWLLASITLLCIWTAHRWPFLIVGWFLFLGTLVPVIGLVQVGWQSIADRYMYLPLLGPIIMAAWGIDALVRRGNNVIRIAVETVSVAAVIGAGAVTVHQLQFWGDTRILFEHALAVAPENAVAHVQLGYLEAGLKHPIEAQRHYEEALRIEPTYYVAEYNLGNLLLKSHPDQAAEHYRRAAEDQPGNAKVENNWGLAALNMNQPNEAIKHFQAAVELAPDFPQPHFGLGLIMLSAGALDAAEAEFRKALEVNPDFIGAQRGLQAVQAARAQHAQ